MRAKEYADQYKQQVAQGKDEFDVLVETLQAFTKEFKELTLRRGRGSDAASLACYNEINQKYRAFARLVTTEDTVIKEGGWEHFMEQIHPDIMDLIKAMRVR